MPGKSRVTRVMFASSVVSTVCCADDDVSAAVSGAEPDPQPIVATAADKNTHKKIYCFMLIVCSTIKEI